MGNRRRISRSAKVSVFNKTKFITRLLNLITLCSKVSFLYREFAVAKFEKHGPNSSAILISETIRCMKSGATLLFRYWHTGDAAVSVCVIRSFSDEILDCQV
jgi:hypothetical protein